MDLRKFMIAALAVSATAAIAHGNKQTSAQTSSDQSSAVTAQNAQQDPSTIREAQQALNDKGYKVTADGQWGPKSSAAVRKFQQKQGIEQSGQLDQQTLAALDVNLSADMNGGQNTSQPSSPFGPTPSSGAAQSSDNAAQSSSSSTPSTPSQTSSSYK